MRRRLLATMTAAAALALGMASVGAKADTITLTDAVNSGNTTNAPLFGDLAPVPPAGSGVFAQGVVGSISDVTLSPYAFNTNGTTNTPYNVISEGSAGSGSATYNLSGSNSFLFLWGSPDSYNTVTFYSGANATGTNVGSFSGSDLTCYSSTCADTGWAEALFTDSTGTFGSVVLANSGEAAFEFGIGKFSTALGTPLPGTLALFAGGLGLLGFVGSRKRRRVARGMRLTAA